jgi:hypothetical protein
MTLQEEKIQDDRIRGTPEIGRRVHLLHRLHNSTLRALKAFGERLEGHLSITSRRTVAVPLLPYWAILKVSPAYPFECS